jgi:hypothetical protein
MFKALLLCSLLLLACLPAKKSPWFAGCLVYENEYRTLAGETLYFAVKPKNWFYVQGANMKWYDRNKKLQQLYIGQKNEFYTFEKGKAVLLATILGYPCQTLQLVKGSVSSLVYYAADLRVKTADFSHCPAPGWYALLQATNGALPLRTVSVDTEHDVTATTEVISVQAMTLATNEFTVTAPMR